MVDMNRISHKRINFYISKRVCMMVGTFSTIVPSVHHLYRNVGYGSVEYIKRRIIPPAKTDFDLI